jgi:UDP-glucose 4-epimerase
VVSDPGRAAVKIVVVGANGFLGSHMVDTLVASGHQVTAVDRFRNPPRFIREPAHTLTLSLSAEGIPPDALVGQDVVIDFLGASTPLMSVSQPTFDTDVTIPTTTTLVDACVSAGVGHYYFASTGGAIYGDSNRDSNREEDTPAPTSPYGQAKWDIEQMLARLRQRGDLRSTVWRLSNPYGPRQSAEKKQGLIAVALHHHLTHTPLPVMGSGEMTRDYIYVADAIEAAANFLGVDTRHDTYNIGTGVGVTVNDVLDTIATIVGQPLATTQVDIPPGFVTRSVVNIDRVNQEFTLPRFTSLAEGVERTLHAFTAARRDH